MTEQSGMPPDDNNNRHVGENLERRQNRVNYLPETRHVYNSSPLIIRKSSHTEAASPFDQRSSLPQVWNPNIVQKSSHQENFHWNNFSNKVGDKSVWQHSHFPPFSSQTRRYPSPSLPTQRGHYSSYEETNEPAESGTTSTSREIQSRNYLSAASQTLPYAPLISNTLDAYVIENNHRPEPQRSSITGFSQGWQSERSSETAGRKNIQSYLFKDSKASVSGHQLLNTGVMEGQSTFPTTAYMQRPSDAQVYAEFSSDFQEKGPNLLYQTADVAQTVTFTQSHHTAAETQAQTLVRPLQGSHDTRERFIPTPYADFQGNYATKGGKPALSSLVNPTTSESTQPQKPEQTNKGIYGFRGFQNPTWRALKEPSVLSFGGLNDSANSRGYTFDKGKYKMTNVYPALSRKYSFKQRVVTTMATTTPAKLERQHTDYSSPSPGAFDIPQILSTPRPVTSGFMEVRPPKSESDTGLHSKTDNRKFRIFRRIYGVKGFSNPPLEGAKALPRQLDESTRVQQDLVGSKLRSSQVWQPESSRIQRYRLNKTEQETKIRDNEPPLKTSGSAKSVHRPAPQRYKKHRRIYNFRGFQPVQNGIGNATNKTIWKNKEHSASQRIPSAFLRSTGPLNVQSHLKPDPRMSNKTKPVAMKASLLNSFTSSTVRGTRVKGKPANTKYLSVPTSRTNDAVNAAIVRQPKPPKKTLRAFTYSDVLGSASYRSVSATTQTPVTPAAITATTTEKPEVAHLTLKSEDAVFDRENSSRGPEEDKLGDFSGVEENKMDIRSTDTDLKTSDSFQDMEGSGSGDLNPFDVFSTKSNGFSDDLQELDYLRISAGNVSFKSMNVSSNER
ncbi:uncharacterized protein LOC117807211 isoform X2 [Notolabrus celidotus]|nr:uncharacterized protein LOC117807211 isoform X2 [Notolabrus celidotus]